MILGIPTVSSKMWRKKGRCASPPEQGIRWEALTTERACARYKALARALT